VLATLTGPDINIILWGGPGTSVGVLVDVGTVLMENILVHLVAGRDKKRKPFLRPAAKWRSALSWPCLSVLAVFLPSSS